MSCWRFTDALLAATNLHFTFDRTFSFGKHSLMLSQRNQREEIRRKFSFSQLNHRFAILTTNTLQPKLQLSEWSVEPLFTFPATCCYLLLITAPHSAVTQTQSDPPRSAPHHTDRQRTLTHFVGELADAVIYVPFFPGWGPAGARVSRAAFRTKENRVCIRCQRDADKESCGL